MSLKGYRGVFIMGKVSQKSDQLILILGEISKNYCAMCTNFKIYFMRKSIRARLLFASLFICLCLISRALRIFILNKLKVKFSRDILVNNPPHSTVFTINLDPNNFSSMIKETT